MTIKLHNYNQYYCNSKMATATKWRITLFCTGHLICIHIIYMVLYFTNQAFSFGTLSFSSLWKNFEILFLKRLFLLIFYHFSALIDDTWLRLLLLTMQYLDIQFSGMLGTECLNTNLFLEGTYPSRKIVKRI